VLFEGVVVLLSLARLLLQLGDGWLHVFDVLLQDGVLLLELDRLDNNKKLSAASFCSGVGYWYPAGYLLIWQPCLTWQCCNDQERKLLLHIKVEKGSFPLWSLGHKKSRSLSGLPPLLIYQDIHWCLHQRTVHILYVLQISRVYKDKLFCDPW